MSKEEDNDDISVSDTTSVTDHHKFIKVYRSTIAESDSKALLANHQFVRDDNEDSKTFTSWEIRMARKYYDQLFKEYAIADISRYKEGKIGLRWRTQNEVFSGKGQFVCGVRTCNSSTDLHSYEIPFNYIENRISKCELVKVRACPGDLPTRPTTYYLTIYVIY